MQLKKYQAETLNKFSNYLEELARAEQDLQDDNAVLKRNKRSTRQENIPQKVWDSIPKPNPEEWGEHRNRKDGIGNSIPNVCIKIPTGGGKTLLGTHAVKLIKEKYLKNDTGLVLWIVPSDAIYRQTARAFKSYDHPYRHILNQAAAGPRAKILERKDKMLQEDVKKNLSVMMLMTQAVARKEKEYLRVFQDNGDYMDFFQSADDHNWCEELLKEHPNLECVESKNSFGVQKIVRYSLGNVIKMLRPIIVLDEGHTAKSSIRTVAIEDFNPSFILELSATPSKECSNILIDVPGKRIKDEEMIKLPIILKNHSNSTWQFALTDSYEKLKELSRKAKSLEGEEGEYIRPIMLVRVEYTGKKQRKPGRLHVQDVLEHLTLNLGLSEEEVRIKSSEEDQIGNEDLLSPACPVKVVITKDALKEGWDCPFAYVLTLLDKTQKAGNLTQIIGRVLRQPYGKATKIEELNNCYVFCLNQDVNNVVKQIQQSLLNHGLGGLAGNGVGAKNTQERVAINRRPEFKKIKMAMPQVLHKEGRGTRQLDYENDILAEISWGKIKIPEGKIKLFSPEEGSQEVPVNVGGPGKIEDHLEKETGVVSEMFFAERLTNVVPNPWQAMKIIKKSWADIKKLGGMNKIYPSRMLILGQMEKEIEAQKEKEAYSIFCEKLKKKEILFMLNTKGSSWEIPQQIFYRYVGVPQYARAHTGGRFNRSLFKEYPAKDFNDFERKVAGYLDESKAVKWWHRVAVRQDQGLQGWKKDVFYPDFVAFIEKGSEQPFVLETKGGHLVGNEDTIYKKKLLELLEKHYFEVGGVSMSKIKKPITLAIVYDDSVWETGLAEVIPQLKSKTPRKK